MVFGSRGHPPAPIVRRRSVKYKKVRAGLLHVRTLEEKMDALRRQGRKLPGSMSGRKTGRNPSRKKR